MQLEKKKPLNGQLVKEATVLSFEGRPAVAPGSLKHRVKEEKEKDSEADLHRWQENVYCYMKTDNIYEDLLHARPQKAKGKSM